ncbi:transfer protein [Kitasatospora sp. NPDC088346]|uniref:transfer protein n=1 Tax=Kitasatospora sp. NPDC088346 TaxID=3364073 RepID=UPI00382757A0
MSRPAVAITPARLPATTLRPEIIEVTVEVPPGKILRYDLDALVSALELDDPSLIAVETAGRHGLITLYPHNPLLDMPAPSPADMLMDRRGYITVGRYHNGRPAKRRMFDTDTGSAQRSLVFGTTGAGKSRTVQYLLACEKRNRVVSWFADLKGGQSAPEAAGQVDWRATSQEEAILMLRAAVRVAEARQRRYTAMGRNSFRIGDPDPLIVVRIDEANRLLEKGAPYRAEATQLVKELGRTGRSVGVGEELDAQASHLEELGGSDTLRAMLKEGEVTLLRWSSSMMRQLVSDGLLPTGAQLMPIPKNFGARVLRSQFDLDVEEETTGPGTQGMGYLLSGPSPTSPMRHFRVGSVSPTPGLDPEILALYGYEEPERLEAASHDAAGTAYAVRGTPAMQGLIAAFIQEQAEKAQPVKPRGAGGGSGGGAERAAAPRVVDRVRVVLSQADVPMDAAAVRAAVNADGGKPVSLGAVKTELGGLVNEGDAHRPSTGLYELT